ALPGYADPLGARVRGARRRPRGLELDPALPVARRWPGRLLRLRLSPQRPAPRHRALTPGAAPGARRRAPRRTQSGGLAFRRGADTVTRRTLATTTHAPRAAPGESVSSASHQPRRSATTGLT